MNYRIIIPNTLTAGNLFMGCLGIYFAGSNNLAYASVCIGIAAVFDFLDGLAARALSGGSEIGKQLDSLADCVSFGALPGLMIFQYISITLGEYFTPLENRPLTHVLMACSGLLIAVFSALRLAKFNLDTRQKDSFLGLPTPANAILIASVPLILEVQYDLNMYLPLSSDAMDYLIKANYFNPLDLAVIHTLYNPALYVVLSFVLSGLLVSELPLLSLKFKGLKFSRNKMRYLLAGLIIVLVGSMQFTQLYFLVIPIIVILYIILSTVYYQYKRNR